MASYSYPHQASLAKSALGAYGVEAWVLEERAAWHAAGPPEVKLAVRLADVEAAREILAGDHSTELASIPEARIPVSPDELCRHCGADALERVRARSGLGLLWRALGYGRWRCRSCGRDQ